MDPTGLIGLNGAIPWFARFIEDAGSPEHIRIRDDTRDYRDEVWAEDWAEDWDETERCYPRLWPLRIGSRYQERE